MLILAERNRTLPGATNVEFLESKITNIILNDSVINLESESNKRLVLNEVFRLLKPGGRAAVSDILAKASMSTPRHYSTEARGEMMLRIAASRA